MKFSVGVWTSFGGDYLTSKKKERMFISVKTNCQTTKEKSDKLLNYSFNESWIIETDDILYYTQRLTNIFLMLQWLLHTVWQVTSVIRVQKLLRRIRWHNSTNQKELDQQNDKRRTRVFGQSVFTIVSTKLDLVQVTDAMNCFILI